METASPNQEPTNNTMELVRSATDIGALDAWVYFVVAIIFFIVCLLSCRESFNFMVAEKERQEKARVAFLESIIFGPVDHGLENYYNVMQTAINDIEVARPPTML